jgi:hypothetical protein
MLGCTSIMTRHVYGQCTRSITLERNFPFRDNSNIYMYSWLNINIRVPVNAENQPRNQPSTTHPEPLIRELPCWGSVLKFWEVWFWQNFGGTYADLWWNLCRTSASWLHSLSVLDPSIQRQRAYQGREIIAIIPLENCAFCTVFSENFHKF